MARLTSRNRVRVKHEARKDPQEILRHEEDNWDEPEPSDRGERAELELLQGPWFSVVGKRQAELLVAGDHFTIRFDGDILYMGVLEVDPGARPKRMHMWIEEGPAPHKGKKALCLYDLAGDTLRWCSPVPGKEEPLAGFPADEDPHYLSLVFRRE